MTFTTDNFEVCTYNDNKNYVKVSGQSKFLYSDEMTGTYYLQYDLKYGGNRAYCFKNYEEACNAVKAFLNQKGPTIRKVV